MKKFNVEIRNDITDVWDGDAIEDVVEAETEEEAIELAKQYLKDCIIDNGYGAYEVNEVDEWLFRATEVDENRR